jgi:hypothetical protein
MRGKASFSNDDDDDDAWTAALSMIGVAWFRRRVRSIQFTILGLALLIGFLCGAVVYSMGRTMERFDILEKHIYRRCCGDCPVPMPLSEPQ